MEEKFYEESVEWMNTLNYSIHSHNSQKSNITFISNDLGGNYPAITCFINEHNEKRCKLSDSGNYKMFLSLNSGDMQFKPSDIDRYIKVFKHYSDLAENYPPF